MRAAIALREQARRPRASSAASRLINAESDGLPGIVVERYGDYLVVQLYTGAVANLRDALYDALDGRARAQGDLRAAPLSLARRRGAAPGRRPSSCAATPAPVELEVDEDDLKFVVDVTAPLSTGLFADLREGRRAVRQWATGRRVLNLFSYTGAISVYAQAGGATEVCAVDVAAKAHARARRNFAASGFDPEKPEHIVGDAFKVLARFVERGRKFDLVVARSAGVRERGGARRQAVERDARLRRADHGEPRRRSRRAACSSPRRRRTRCRAQEFELALADGALRAGTRLQIIDRRAAAAGLPDGAGVPRGQLPEVRRRGARLGSTSASAVSGTSGDHDGARRDRASASSVSIS